MGHAPPRSLPPAPDPHDEALHLARIAYVEGEIDLERYEAVVDAALRGEITEFTPLFRRPSVWMGA